MEGPSGSQREPALPRVDAFLEAKLHPPALRTKWVHRDRLIRALELSTADCPLTLVAAPAGYGKTTVVAQWLDQMTERNLAWVRLDAADNDPVQDLDPHRHRPRAGGLLLRGGAANLVATHASDITNGLLPEIVNALAAAPVPDPLGRSTIITSSAPTVCHEQIDLAHRASSAAAALLILSRADPALHLGRLRAAGSSAEIRADRLSFDARRQGPAGDEDIQLSDGRPVRAYEANGRLARRAVPGDDVPDRSRRSRCLRTRIQRRQSVHRGLSDGGGSGSPARRCSEPSSSRFRSSSGSRHRCVNTVLQTPGASRILQDLERSNLFLVPLDANRHWFRFHHLFAAVARERVPVRESGPGMPTARRGRPSGSRPTASSTRPSDTPSRPVRPPGRRSSSQANWIRYVDAGRAATVDGWPQALRPPSSRPTPPRWSRRPGWP